MTATCGEPVATALDDFAWPAARLGEALEALARHCRWPVATATPGAPPAKSTGDRLARWLEATAARLGLEVEPVAVPYPEMGRLLAGGGPTLVSLPGGATFLLLVGG